MRLAKSVTAKRHWLTGTPGLQEFVYRVSSSKAKAKYPGARISSYTCANDFSHNLVESLPPDSSHHPTTQPPRPRAHAVLRQLLPRPLRSALGPHCQRRLPRASFSASPLPRLPQALSPLLGTWYRVSQTEVTIYFEANNPLSACPIRFSKELSRHVEGKGTSRLGLPERFPISCTPPQSTTPPWRSTLPA